MTQSAESRMQCALSNMLNDIDKLHLRQIQADMHKCAAKCCEDRESSVELVHACIEICSQNLKKAQKVFQDEFFILQRRLQECVLTCNNETRNKFAKHPIDYQIKSYSLAFDSCMDKCVDSNIALIPFIMKKMKEVLANRASETKASQVIPSQSNISEQQNQ